MTSTGPPPAYDVPLEDLLRNARVPLERLVEEQAAVEVPAADGYDAEATGMGMPRLPGAGWS